MRVVTKGVALEYKSLTAQLWLVVAAWYVCMYVWSSHKAVYESPQHPYYLVPIQAKLVYYYYFVQGCPMNLMSRTSEYREQRMNKYCEQSSRILVSRSRISFPRRDIETLSCTQNYKHRTSVKFKLLPIYLSASDRHLSHAAPDMCTQICSYILGRWQNVTPNTKYLSPHSSPLRRPIYNSAAGRTLLSIILAAFVRYEYEERG